MTPIFGQPSIVASAVEVLSMTLIKPCNGSRICLRRPDFYRHVFCFLLFVLRSVCTSTRFGALVPRACPFCDAPAQDQLPHFASCPAVAALLDAVSPGCPSLWKENRDTRLFLTTNVRNMREFCFHALILDLVLSCYNGLTHGSIRSRAELRAHGVGRIRGWASYSPRMRDIVRELFVI